VDYAGFKAFLTTFLWRDGDAVVTSNLDSLIKMANASLNRDLKVEDRATTVDIVATSPTVPMPADCREIRQLSLEGKGQMTYYTPGHFESLDASNAGRVVLPIYTTIGTNIFLTGDVTATTPATLTAVYYANIPDFAATLTSWVADDYLDVYAYSVLKHTAPFLREDERLQVWGSLYDAALNSALAENAARKQAGGPLRIIYGKGRA
jgi:hypothetical protein